jgi:hypothetical protein
MGVLTFQHGKVVHQRAFVEHAGAVRAAGQAE